jgi:CMP-N-acetylneuraminic acid synthetase
MNIVALICARSGSKGVPDKNIKPLAGKSLILRSINQIKELKEINRVIVSTDSEKIADIVVNAGAEVPFMRPKKLAEDNVPEWLVWRHALESINEIDGGYPDILIVVPVTAPLRTVDDLKKCLTEYQKGNADVIITATDSHRNPYFNMVKIDKKGMANLVISPKETIIRRQDTPYVYDMTTVAYVTNPKFVLENDSIFSGKVRHVYIPIERALDIDTPFDFKIAELLLSKE